MMSKKRIAIIGLGLIGGSLGLALKRAVAADFEVVGFARRPEVASYALSRGAVDKTEAQLTDAVSEADIVIVATPLMTFEDIFAEIAGSLKKGAIVSDVGSTKSEVMRWALNFLPSSVNFIGGHPMTGKETSGFGEAEAGLFDGCVYCLVPSEGVDAESLKVMEDMVKLVGARPFVVDAARHDEMVAGISHLPLLISSSLVSALFEDELWPEMARLASTGFRDITRLASGSPELHHGICATNQRAIVSWLDKYIENLKKYRQLIFENDQELQKSLAHARDARQKWLENEGRRFNK